MKISSPSIPAGDVGQLAEWGEAEALYTLASGANAAVAAEFGIDVAHVGGGIVVSTLHDATGFWSRAIGLGITEPVDADVISDVLTFFRRHSNPRATIQIAPALLPPDWPEISARFGLRAGAAWAKLARPTAGFQPQVTDLNVAPIAHDEAPQAAAVMAECFGMSAGLVAGLYVPALRSGAFQGFAAWDEDRMVAVGGMRVHRAVASMYGAATLPEYRRRGAQSALLAARAEEARSRGCEWLIAETGIPESEGGNPSLNNMLKAGFEILYPRTNWIWQNDEQ